MSYDIYFAKRRPGQTWEEALEELEEAAEDDVPLPADLLAAWDRILPQAVELLGDFRVLETEDTHQLDDDSGLQATFSAGEVMITIPYRHSGTEAERILALAYALAAVIERETGLEGYDPQTDRAIADSRPATDAMSTIATHLRTDPDGRGEGGE